MTPECAEHATSSLDVNKSNKRLRMKNIKILGTGCARCKQTEAVIRETLADIGLEAEIEKVTDIEQIFAYDVMVTPAVVVDGKVLFKGKVPTKDEVKAMIA